MNRCVVDASVVLKWFVPENLQAEADALFEWLAENGIAVHAPDLIELEVANAVWKKFVHKELSRPEANEVIADMDALPLQVHRSGPLVRTAFDISCELHRTVCDSTYLSLAASLDCECFTADHALFSEVRNSRWGKHVVWLGDCTPHGSV